MSNRFKRHTSSPHLHDIDDEWWNNEIETKLGKSRRGRKEYKCRECSNRYRARSSLTRHVESVHRQGTNDCDNCNASFKEKNSLKLHIDSVHLNRHERHVCPGCSKVYPYRRNLVRHMKHNCNYL